jgi:hypothetical protein
VAPFPRKRLAANEKPEYLAKHPHAGRPTTYKPEYCDQVIDFMGKGGSLTAFAGSLKQSAKTIYAWVERHPEFADAVERARAARLVPWEQKLMTAEKSAQAACAIFALKNCAPDEWREVRYANFEHDVNINTLSDAQLESIAMGRRAADVGAIDVQYNRLLERPKLHRPRNPKVINQKPVK